MEQYKLIAENNQSTVVADYEPMASQSASFQSEEELEKTFIEQLQRQGYEYLNFHTEGELVDNLRHRLEELNDFLFSDGEWNRFFEQEIANKNYSIADKSRIIQEDHIRLLMCDDGSTKNIFLLDKRFVHNNYLQVINQYVPEGGAHENRYDVSILVNGLPLVHVELKRRGVHIKEAFNQIRRYGRESFWAGCGLFDYVQIFVISNGTFTKYYSNTTRQAHLNEVNKCGKGAGARKIASHSFEFTNYWATRSNIVLPDITDFTATFFAKNTLLNVLMKYCVLTCDNLLLAMRPYQIAATESIIQRILTASTYKKCGSVDGGGYIWHTTGSGKTLTSFKAARLASEMDGVDKVLFVVDRKDLDYQTMREYDRFEKGAANSNSSTAILKSQLENDDVKIIITTIQKLSVFVKKNDKHDVYGRHVVMIFDECHRSQFGSMHSLIVKKFRRYHLFGFTGTPIFTDNMPSSGRSELKTTEQAFGDKLHVYTIVDAINDGNVLPFRVDYVSTMREQEDIKDEKVRDIDRERALASPLRVEKIVGYVLDNFARKTMRDKGVYSFTKLMNISDTLSRDARELREKKRLRGFNALFAVSSIEMAKRYYLEFKRQMGLRPENERLKVATIFSYAPNEDVEDVDGLLEEENPESAELLDSGSREFLESAIGDYNKMFATNYDTSSERFQNYYKDVSLRMKNKEIDLLIVVNMFLTGFDATTLNTLFVDKNLRMHGLLQAYSRTNRILNSVKCFGNIVCFRNLEKATNKALATFGDKGKRGTILLRSFEEYYNGYVDEKDWAHLGYRQIVERLLKKFPLGVMIAGRTEMKAFIALFGMFLRVENVLSVFDEFIGMEILTERQRQDYQSVYLMLYDKLRAERRGDDVNINDDIVFEIELVKQVEIDIDYILFLVDSMGDDRKKNKSIEVDILKAVDSSLELREKKKLIETFIRRHTSGDKVYEEWREYILEQESLELDLIIDEEGLARDEAFDFMRDSFRNGFLDESGTDIVRILPPMPLFGRKNSREEKKRVVVERLKAFFDRFYSLSGGRL